MTENSDINELDGGMEMEKGSDPDVDLLTEPPLLDGESVQAEQATETSHTNATESENVVGQSEPPSISKTNIESEPPSTKQVLTSESEGVVLDPSYNVFGRIILEEEQAEEEAEVEEEEMVPSALTVITYDCLEGENRIELMEEGYRQFGTVGLLRNDRQGKDRNKDNEVSWNMQRQEKCRKKKSPFLDEKDEMEEVSWVPTLESAIYSSDPTPTFNNIENLKKSLASAKTYILQSSFDSTVFPGVGETPVDRYTLCNDRIEVDVINFGARVVAVRLFDKDRWVDVALGLDNVAGYLCSKSDYMGATLGRVAGKICNAKFKAPDHFGGGEFYLSKNNGDDHYNGGFRALHKRLWETKRCGDSLVMVCRCYDKEDGYPGDLTVWVTFSLTGDCAINIEYYAEADSATPINITNAIYFNLAGHDSGPRSIYDHSVFVNSEVCSDPENIYEGKLGLVYKSPYNLTDPKHLGCVMQKVGGDGLDVFYVLYRQVPQQARETDPIPRPNMITAAIAHHEESGRTLVVSTNQWALRLYTCNNLEEMKGKGSDTAYGKHFGFCFQPGNLPNAVNIEHFPETFVTENEPYRHIVRYQFSIDRDTSKKAKMFLNKAPWLQDDVCLRCDVCPKGVDSITDQDLESPYKKMYNTLEKLPLQPEGDDEDNLSIHSSFTSFGSSDDLPLVEGNMDVMDTEGGEATETAPTSDQAECTPMMVVMEQGSLPPHLTGKWPRNPIQPPPPEQPLPVPTKRECPTASTLSKGEPLPKENIQQPASPGISTQKGPPKKKGKDLRQINTKQYKPVKVGIINRSDKEKYCEMDAMLEIPLQPDDLDLSDSSVDSEINLVHNPVMGRSGDWKFRWLESPEKLPWYMTKKGQSKPGSLSEQDRRKKMGRLFTMVNFPDYFDYNGTEAELVHKINLQNQYMKSLYNSIRYFPKKIKLSEGLKEFSDSDIV